VIKITISPFGIKTPKKEKTRRGATFLDAYSSYHQISLAIDNEEKIVFITSIGIFCYTKMMFDLKMREQCIRRAFISSWKLKSEEMSKHISMMW
jgi:hypothetical protein